MKILTPILALLIFASCATTLDRDVEYDVHNAPIIDDASTVLAIPILIQVSTLDKESKVSMMKDYKMRVEKLANGRLRQRKIIYTLTEKMTVQDYPKNKIKQLLAQFNEIDKSSSREKRSYMQKVFLKLHGKIDKNKVKEVLMKIENELQGSETGMGAQEVI